MPGGMHPNCQCSGEPVLDGSDINDPPIEPVYPIEELIALLWGGGLARRLGIEAIRRISGEEEVLTQKPENHSQTAEKIAEGHAFDKHSDKIPNIKTREEFKKYIEDVMNNPSETKILERGRKAYWDDKTGMVVIENPLDPDGGTAFRPDIGKTYFDMLL